MAIRTSVPARAQCLGALASLWLALCLSLTSQPAEAGVVTGVNSIADLTSGAAAAMGCDESDFAVEGFEDHVGGIVEASSDNPAIGVLEVGDAFESKLVLCRPDPNDSLILVDLAEGTLRYTLGANGDIAKSFTCEGGANAGEGCFDDDDCPGGTCELDRFACEGGDNAGEACVDDDDCPGGTCEFETLACAGGDNAGEGCVDDDDCPGGICKSKITAETFECDGGDNDGEACLNDDDCPDGTCESVPGLPSGTSYAATNTRFGESLRIALPESDSRCNAVGMFVSSFDGVAVTLSLINQAENEIGRVDFPANISPNAPLGGPARFNFIGVVADIPFRSVEISSSEIYAFDDVWHPTANITPAIPCPEPSSASGTIAAILAIAALSARRRCGSPRRP